MDPNKFRRGLSKTRRKGNPNKIESVTRCNGCNFDVKVDKPCTAKEKINCRNYKLSKSRDDVGN